LDPAIGDGELIVSLLSCLQKRISNKTISVVGFETDKTVVKKTSKRILTNFPNINIEIKNIDFIEYMLNAKKIIDGFDYIIANPPYVRTQILGADKAQNLASRIGLTGRVDLYYAFLFFAEKLLKDSGIAGFITSNKFMTVKSGNSVREKLLNDTNIIRIVDFGDTKLFNAAVLPCIITFTKGRTLPEKTQFTSIYEIKEENKTLSVETFFDCLEMSGVISLSDGRKFEIKQGVLEKNQNCASWHLSNTDSSRWLEKVENKTWKKFSEIGKIRVGIKTTADNVFIKDDWTYEEYVPELLYPLITHRNAGQILPNDTNTWQVLYPYAIKDGKKITLNISEYPNTRKYLEKHRKQLEGREYIKKANRQWYEIWVPQNPLLWSTKKIVFREIAGKPEFWFDRGGAIINGDCYWIDMLPFIDDSVFLLALAVANSTFIEKYYDMKFNNKIYAGKRRYMAQYVSDFPVPDPNLSLSRKAIELVKKSIQDGNLNKDDKIRIDTIVERLFS
jgi:hypothetical protein